MTHFLTTAHIAVQRLHQYTREETILLSEVNKEACITFLSLIHALLAVGLHPVLFPLSNFHLLNFRCISIVSQELTKLQ